MTETNRTSRKSESKSRRRTRKETPKEILRRRMIAARREYDLKHPRPMFPHDDGVNPTENYGFDIVLTTTECREHGAAKYKACYAFYRLEGGISQGICNERALAAGMNHPISPRALNIG